MAARRSAQPETVTFELESLTARIGRALMAARIDADRVGLGATGIGETIGELAATDATERIRTVAVQVRAVATDMLLSAAMLYATAERLEALAELVDLGVAPDVP